MLTYYNPRLKIFRNDLQYWFQYHDLEVERGLQKSRASLTETQRNLQVILKDMLAECRRPHRQGKSATADLESLVLKSLEVRQLGSALHDLEKILESAVVAKKLHTFVCFLGRLGAAHRTFLTLASTTGTFSQVKIHIVAKLKPLELDHSLLTTPELFKLLKLDLSDDSVKQYISQKKTLQEVSETLAKGAKRKGFVHAEVQLYYIAQNGIRDLFPFIGASKRGCFLCASFIKVSGGFETRGSHGHLYSKCLVPQMKGICPEEAHRITRSLERVQQILETQLRSPIPKPISAIPQSSIGLTEAVADAAIPIIRDSPSVARYLQERATRDSQQLELRRFQQLMREHEAKGVVDSALTSSASQVTESEDLMEEAQALETVINQKTGGECLVCQRWTTRRCFKCEHDRFCSPRCEGNSTSRHAFTCNLGRPLNTADYLMRDCEEVGISR